MQETGRAVKMSVTYGHSSRTPFAYFDPDGSCWRTSQGTFLSDWDQFSETWPNSGMTRSGDAFELPTLEPLTDGNASSFLLPTPLAQMTGASQAELEAGNPKRRLETEVELLPTPVADHSRGLAQPGSDFQSLPNVALDLLPTPCAADQGPGQTPEARKARGHGSYLEDVAHLLPTPTTSPDRDTSSRPDSGGPALGQQIRALPTPTAVPQSGNCREGYGRGDLLHQLTCDGTCETTTNDDEQMTLLPTPTAQAAKHGSTPDVTAASYGSNLWDLPQLLPTPNPFHMGNDEELEEWLQRRAEVQDRTGTRHGPALTVVAKSIDKGTPLYQGGNGPTLWNGDHTDPLSNDGNESSEEQPPTPQSEMWDDDQGLD